jgi:hypothetical protein
VLEVDDSEGVTDSEVLLKPAESPLVMVEILVVDCSGDAVDVGRCVSPESVAIDDGEATGTSASAVTMAELSVEAGVEDCAPVRVDSICVVRSCMFSDGATDGVENVTDSSVVVSREVKVQQPGPSFQDPQLVMASVDKEIK